MNLRLGSVWMLLVAALPGPLAAQGRTTYCCTDDRGKQVCSDVLPQQCYGRAYREINPAGVTVRRIDAPLTAEQRAMKEAEAKKAREEELRQTEQDRRNRALLATYASEADIDASRDRAVADIGKTIRTAEEKLAELAKRQKKLDVEAEFYKKGTPPPELKAQLRDNETDMKALQAVIESKKREIETVKARHDDDRRRYRELTEKKPVGQGGAAASKGADTRPR